MINWEQRLWLSIWEDTYEQMGVFRTTLGPEDHDIIFNVNDNPVTMKLDTTVNNSDVLIGLIVTDIPENQTVTITMDQTGGAGNEKIYNTRNDNNKFQRGKYSYRVCNRG